MNKKQFQALAESVSEDEFKDFVGIKAYNFLNAKNKLESGKSADDFSFLAFVAHVFYGAYYKYWMPMITFIIGVFILIVVSDTPEMKNGMFGFQALCSRCIGGFIFDLAT